MTSKGGKTNETGDAALQLWFQDSLDPVKRYIYSSNVLLIKILRLNSSSKFLLSG